MSGGGSIPVPQASAETWIHMVNSFQKGALSTRLGIPMFYGIDAVHGHNIVYKATIFPHNIGLGATRQYTLILVIFLRLVLLKILLILFQRGKYCISKVIRSRSNTNSQAEPCLKTHICYY